MTVNLDKKMLSGFSHEVKSYLPPIRQGIENFAKNPSQSDALEDALRYIHTIKGASALIGLVSLSQVATYIEDILEQIASGQESLDALRSQWLEFTIEQIEPYLECLLDGHGENRELVESIEKKFLEIDSYSEKRSLSQGKTMVEDGIEDCEIPEYPSISKDDVIPIHQPDGEDIAENESLQSVSCAANSLEDDGKEPLDSEEVSLSSEEMSIKITSSSIDIEKNELIEHAPEVIDNEMDDERDNIQKNILNASECDSEFEQEMPACSEDNGDSLESKEKIATPEFDSYDAIYTDFLDTVKLIPEHCENETLNIDEHNNLFDAVTVEDHDCEGDSNTSKINYSIDNVSDVTQDEAEIDDEIKNHDIVGDQENISSLNHDMSGIDSIEKCKVTRETDHDAEVLTLHNNSDENITSEQLEQSLITDEASNTLEEIINSIDNDVKNIYRVENQQSAGSVKQQHYRTTRYLLFTIGKSHYAFTVANILEIALVPTITPLPNVPNWLKGVINLRGEILSVIDLGLFFEVKNSVKHDDNRLLVVSTEDGEVATSLIVDQVNGFIQLDSSRDSDTSIVFHDKVTPYLSGVFECEGMILATLDLERLLKSSEVCQFN